MTALTRLSLDQAHTLASQVLRAHSVSAPQARAIADTVTAAERDDCKSHGLFRLPGYVSSVRSGKVTPDAVPQVYELAPAIVQVDGQNGFAPLALQIGCEPLADKARRHGIAALAVTRIYHFAALWPEVEALAAQDLVALAFTAAMSYVAPAGGNKPLYGTNPMAFAWPRAGHPRRWTTGGGRVHDRRRSGTLCRARRSPTTTGACGAVIRQNSGAGGHPITVGSALCGTAADADGGDYRA